tara:strand:- start:902 stop:1156 length:255 start_codon:yes stop_codon:yes gene_type:complete
MSREPAEEFLGKDMEGVRDEISKVGRDGFVSSLRSRTLSKTVSVRGRTIVDEQGAMILADSAIIETVSPDNSAKEVMEKWGVTL